jgi:hypothetical protein
MGIWMDHFVIHHCGRLQLYFTDLFDLSPRREPTGVHCDEWIGNTFMREIISGRAPVAGENEAFELHQYM